VFNFLANAYITALNKALAARILVLSAVIALAAGSALLIPKLGMELIPSMAQGEFYVELTLPSGSQLENTDAMVAELGRFTQSLAGVKRTYALSGTGSLMNASANQGGEYWGKLNVVLEPQLATAQIQDIQQQMRSFLANQAGVQGKFGQPALFTMATPLEVELSGYDLADLSHYSQLLLQQLSADPHFSDVQSSLQTGNPELKVKFDHAKLAQLNLKAADVSKLIAVQIGGEVATKYSILDRKVDVLVRTQERQRDSITDIGQIIVNPGSSNAIPLNAVADITMSVGPSEITRVGQQRVALLSMNLQSGDLDEAVAVASTYIKNLGLPLNMQARVTGQSEEMQHSFTSLKFALALAIFLVYLVMASQFESLLHPLLILFTVPLACAGSIYGLYFTSTHISVVVFIGLIMLAGIVVNNAIVLIDRINQLRAEGLDKTAAIIASAQSRLRPILMTTLTTSLGLLPMAIGLGEGAEIRAPMAVTVIYGLSFATLLTLFFIPVIYSLFDRKQFIAAPVVNKASEEIVYG
jgi:hydrophobic/amphiphilic exporter-1 (mainly G- bacteria), HAE1 family